MPACALADGETINLSYLTAEDTWNRMRDVGLKDRRRREPPAVWLGAITCECILQSVAAFSLQSSPMPAQWPSFIEHPFLSMQRVACIDDAAVSTVGELWERGGHIAVGEEAPWAYLPVFAFLKQFPAHSPMLLPPGFVSEGAYSQPAGRFAIDLTPSGAPPQPVRIPLQTLLPKLPLPSLLPLSACSAHSKCSGRGWCDGSPSGSTPRCRCAAEIGQRAPATGGLPGARTCAPRGHYRERREWQVRWASPPFLPQRTTGRRQRQRRSRRPRPRLLARLRGHLRRVEVSKRLLRPRARPLRVWLLPLPAWLLGPRLQPLWRACRGGGGGGGGGALRSSSVPHARRRPRIFAYPIPPALRRSCNWWHLGEDIGERLLRSEYLEADPRSADLYWIYGCPNGDTILPALRWIKTAYPFWNASVAAHAPRHALVVGHEEGWAEAWRYLVHWLRGPTGDHANAAHAWDELHPASPTRQLAILQLSGQSDYPAEGMRAPIRCVSSNAPCYVCFQPGKDVMLPGHPGLIDYPRGGQCDALARAKAFDGSGAPAPRPRRPQVLFGGAVWTIPQGPDLYQPSRLVFYLCHKNASRLRGRDYLVVQSETQPESVRAWEVDARINLERAARDASFCIVPEGKAGGYGHRAISYIMLGCVPIYSKERFSRDIFDEAIDWTKVALHVPPSEMPRLPQILERVDAEALRAAAAGMRRRLLWSSIYGPCHLADGEGGGADAFDTLMEVLATPRRHFRVTNAHRAPRAPEQHKDLKAWLRRHGGDYCTATLQ